jgi:hypothetical protein
MALDPNDTIVQDRTDLNEIVVESFPAHPPVRHVRGLLGRHAHPRAQSHDSSSIDEKKNGADAEVSDVEETEAIPSYDANGKDRVLG